MNNNFQARSAPPVILTPGHYISMRRGASQADMLEPLQQPGVAGLQVRYTWGSLEAQYGVLDLDQVKSDAKLARHYGKTLVAMIEDKTFGDPDRGIWGENPMPDYMAEYAIANRQDGYTSARWLPQVVSRLGWIGESIRDAGIAVAFQETAPGIEPANLKQHGYTPADYADAIIALSGSCDYLYLNYVPQEQSQVGRIIRNASCAVGGPDLLPHNDKLLDDVYPWFRDTDVPNTVTMFTSCQFHSLAHQKKDGSGIWPLDELVDWARKELRVSTIFWNIPWLGMPGHSIEAIFAEIAKRPRL